MPACVGHSISKMAKVEAEEEANTSTKEVESSQPTDVDKATSETPEQKEANKENGFTNNINTTENKMSYKKLSGEHCYVQKPDGEWRKCLKIVVKNIVFVYILASGRMEDNR